VPPRLMLLKVTPRQHVNILSKSLSFESGNAMRHVWRFERFDFRVGQFYIQSSHCFFEMVRFGRANDRRRHRRFVKQPRERDLRAGDASRLRNFPDAINDLFVHFFSS
jgi:hypothetical protein